MANVLYNSFKRDPMNGSIDLATDTVKVILVTSSYTPNINFYTKRSEHHQRGLGHRLHEGTIPR
jgi:hypothetical protein